VLLLDEPTSALDAPTQAAVENTLNRLVGELGVSLVLVTHDRGQAGRLAGRTVDLTEASAA
jgi:ABC-type sulfate/molybdate transport systems ATPase subunit